MITEKTITDVFESFFQRYKDLELAEEAFREEMAHDDELKNMYIEWCDEIGYSDRKGFKTYFENKHESDNIWDSIFPNSEEYEGYER